VEFITTICITSDFLTTNYIMVLLGLKYTIKKLFNLE